MIGRRALEREIREILIAANSSEATDAQLARLDELIRDDAHLARYTARLLDQQAALAWQGVSGVLGRGPTGNVQADSDAMSEPTARRNGSAPTAIVKLWHGASSNFWPAAALAATFAMGVVAANMMWWGDRPHAAELARYEVQLVRGTSCLWDESSSATLSIGSRLTSGESLHLLEGLAEFNLDWAQGGSATLTMEGPAAMMLTSEGMPALRYGKLTATIDARQRPFILETSVGRLVLSDYGSIGVAAFGNDAEIHVFDGTAALESAWDMTARRTTSPIAIEAGEALRIKEGANGEVLVERHPAEQSYFVTQMSMASDALVVPPTYIAAIKAARPLGYWRMEHAAWPMIANEMGPRFPCRVEGLLGRTGRPGNEAVEFGVTDQGGDIVSEESLDDAIGDSYTIEVWIKPSHYHVGAVASLVGQPDTPASAIPHGMLLELGGSGLIPTAVHHPGRIRFLHRSPASNDSATGTSCYSTAAYNLRKWQHLVAVKDGAKMRLYINGENVGEGDDDSQMSAGMHLLVGRLYPARNVRPFKGQMDELALYNRALTAAEVEAHYRIIRPQAPPDEPRI
jgi:hypothetical protein